ncbi:hypothetical protein GQ457_16G025130 [Hibiscus cannabinus]
MKIKPRIGSEWGLHAFHRKHDLRSVLDHQIEALSFCLQLLVRTGALRAAEQRRARRGRTVASSDRVCERVGDSWERVVHVGGEALERGCDTLASLRIARDKGYVLIQVQSDSVDAINLLSPPSMLSPFSLVRSIAILCVGDCDIVFSMIPREANMVADFMSKLDSSSSIAIYDSVSLTPRLRDLLHRDSFDPPYVRIRHL